jgi:hypothetical protein
MDNNRPLLLEMEEKLHADDSGAYRSGLLTVLHQEQGRLKRALAVGATPDAFARLSAMDGAFGAAIDVIEAYRS